MKLQERIKNCFVKCKTSTLKTLERIKTGFNKMKSRNKIIVVVTIILLLLSIVTLSVVFSVRGNNATNQTTIVFDTVDGVEIEPLLINNEYQLPAPTREGYTFIGWFANPEHIGDPITSVSPQDAESITVYAKWEIIKTDYDMSSASWNYTEPFTYDGSEKIVSVTGLPEGVTVIEYTSNTATNVGNYTASVTFNYDNANYNEPSIADLDWNIAQATNNWTEALNISGWIYNGTANSPTASATFGTASFSYSDSETGTYNSIVPTDAGTWWIKATVAETTNYTSLEDITSFDIAKADFDMTGVSWDYVSAFTYDGTAKTVELTGLPNGVEIDKYSNHIKTDAGNYTASVTFDYDTTNYNEPSVADLNWVISKADYDMSGVSWDYVSAFTYDGTAKTVELTGLPNGVEIDKYSNHIKTEVGNYTASVTFVYDTTNYNEPSIADLEWEISKANYDMSGASWVYTEAFTYDGNEKTVTVTGLPSGITVDEYTDNAKTSVGTYTASVTFTYDSDNYNTPSMADLEWEIKSAGTEGLQYTYISGTDSYSVSYGSATDTDIVILSSYDDGTNGLKPVTTIAESAFSCKNLTSVTIPNSVTTIGKHAFIGNYLTSVTIPNSVTTIGIEAFYDNSLTSVTIPNSVTTIESNAFAFNSLTSVTISNSVTTIGSGTFAHNSLTSVIIPDSVTTIGSCVFTCNDVYIYTQVASKPANWMEDWSLGILGVYWLGEW